MADPTIIKVGFSLIENLPKEDKADCNHCFILYHDPVLDIDITWGAKPESFTLVKYEHIPGKKIREYTPFQMPALVGLREISIIEYSLNRVYGVLCGTPDLVWKILSKSGYTLNIKIYDITSTWKLNCAMRERPDLFERRELLEI